MMGSRKRNGKLELPGGAVEDGEDPSAGARRELIEETGHDWRDPVLVQQRHGPLGEGFVYLCELGPKVAEPEASTTRIVFAARLPDRGELSFPDDPYPELFAAARAHLAKRQGAPARP